MSSAGRRRARGRWNERRLCTRRAAADRACAPGSPRRSGPAPGASRASEVGPASEAGPASDAGPAPGSRSGAGFWVVGGAGGAMGGGGGGAGEGGAWGGVRECLSAAGGTSRGDDRPVSGVSEPVSHVCGLGWGAVGLLLGAFGQLQGVH